MHFKIFKNLFIYFYLVSFYSSILAEETVIPQNTRQIGQRETAHYSLKGEYPQLSHISRTISSQGGFFDFQGNFPILNQVNLQSTSGPLTLWLKGSFPALTVIELKTTSGDVTFDLQSPLAEKAALVIKTTSGDIHLKLPATVFAKVEAKTSSGSVKVYGMQKSIWCWSTYCYTSYQPREDYQLEIQLETTSGHLFIEQQT